MLVTYKWLWIIMFTTLVLNQPLLTLAQNSSLVEQLRSQIDNRTAQIASLEKEIKQYEQSLNTASKQASTLKNELAILDTERKKLNSQIKLTENKISQTNTDIRQLTNDIGDKDEAINDHQAALGESLRQMRDMESDSFVETLLASEDFSEIVVDQARFADLQGSINDQIASLRELKVELSDKKLATEAAKQKLLNLNNDLGDQKKLSDQNRQQKNNLLTETKSSEAAYQQLLADRRAKKEAFERELYEYESQLRIAIDPSLLPKRGSRVLAWPLDNIFITQLFGKTSDSGRLYASGSHNGVDFRVAIGTPIKAVSGGVVAGIGNTDTVCAGASYGKWILIKHNNGLSTVYGHLSLIKVAANQAIVAGQVIGLSGNTGYSTGPHLHLGVFASQGVSVAQKKSQVCSGTYTMPIASTNAYLDPMEYLPAL